MQQPALLETEPTQIPLSGTLAAPAPIPASESLAALAHDARNLITALALYCDLIEEPGVLAPPFAHYGDELRLVAAAGRRLAARLGSGLTLVSEPATGAAHRVASVQPALRTAPAPFAPASARGAAQLALDDGLTPAPVTNLAAELLAIRNLLAALAGPGIALTVDVEGGASAVPLTVEDLTRILVNLVKNASEAMTAGGRIRIGLNPRPSAGGATAGMVLTFEDNGPGIPAGLLDKVFEPGFTTRAVRSGQGLAAIHRGLGLAITRSIVESAGGAIRALERQGRGACFQIELPVI